MYHVLQKSLRLSRFKSDRDEIWQDCSSSKYTTIYRSRISDITEYFPCRWRPWRPPAARFCIYSSVRRLPATSPSACDVTGWLSVLQFLIHRTFVLVSSTVKSEYCYEHYHLAKCEIGCWWSWESSEQSNLEWILTLPLYAYRPTWN